MLDERAGVVIGALLHRGKGMDTLITVIQIIGIIVLVFSAGACLFVTIALEKKAIRIADAGPYPYGLN